MADVIEHELCANCKKEIPQTNYVMHTVHCSRNYTLCPNCKEPIQKNQLEGHKKTCHQSTKPPNIRIKPMQNSASSATEMRTSQYNKVESKTQQSSSKIEREIGATALPPKINGTTNKPTSNYALPSKDTLLACKYCELELPKLDLDDHENYCGTRTDKCNECGEFVMFKYKKLHEDSNHGFLKLSDEPGPRSTWDSTTQRTTTAASSNNESYSSRRTNLPPLQPFDMTSMYNMVDYMPPSAAGYFPDNRKKNDKSDSYKEMSRRLDCKTEYIRNLLHDSASITAPLRASGTAPRNHFNHNKGPAPLPPHRRRNPPTELTIPCEFCSTPIPHEDLIQHETGCRPDLARFNPRRYSPEPDDYYFAPAPSSPEVELPCEFCSDMFPASQLLKHQLTCS